MHRPGERPTQIAHQARNEWTDQRETHGPAVCTTIRILSHFAFIYRRHHDTDSLIFCFHILENTNL